MYFFYGIHEPTIHVCDICKARTLTICNATITMTIVITMPVGLTMTSVITMPVGLTMLITITMPKFSKPF